MTEPMNRRRLRRLWILWGTVGVLAILLFHSGTLQHLNSRVIGDASGDMPGYHLSVLTWVRDTLRAGHWPLWNPLIFCGYPQWSEGQLGLVGPLGPLLVAFPLIAALNLWWICIHALGVVAAMWWLSSLRISPGIALVGALSIAFSAPIVLRMTGGHPNLAACYPWAFLLLGFWNRWWQGHGRRMLVGAALAWSLIVWSGHIQTAYHLGLWWGVVTLATHGLSGPPRDWGRSLGRWVRGMLFVGGVGSVAAAGLMLPQVEFGLLSPRSRLGVYESSTFDFPVENFLTLLFPGCLGEGLTDSPSASAGPYLGRWYHVWETTLFLNPLILVGVMLPWARRDRLVVRGLWVAGLVCLLLALGRQTPVFQGAYYVLPGIRSFRCHGRLMAPLIFMIVALGCLGFDHYFRRVWVRIPRGKSAPRRRTWRRVLLPSALGVSCVALLAVGMAQRWPDSAAGSVVRIAACAPILGPSLERFPSIPPGTSLEYFWEKPGAKIRTQVFVRAALPALGIWTGLLALLFFVPRLGEMRQRLLGFSVLAVAGLCVAAWWAWPYRRTMDPARNNLSPAAVEAVRAAVGSGRAMILGAGDRNLLLRQGIPVAAGYAALLGKRQNTILQVAQNHPETTGEYQSNAWEVAPQARWLGISAWVAADPTFSFDPGFPPVFSEGSVRVWGYPAPVPRAFFVTGAIGATSYESAIWMLRDPAQATAGQVILETSEPVGLSDGPLRELPMERPSPTEIRVDLRGAPAGWVVVLESLLPGWRAWVDGKASVIVPAQVAFQAVKVPGDARELRLRYRPMSFVLGMGISLLATAFLGYGLVTTRRGGTWHRRLPGLAGRGPGRPVRARGLPEGSQGDKGASRHPRGRKGRRRR